MLDVWHNLAEISIRMLTVHCNQNYSYEVTMNDYKGSKINEMKMSIPSTLHSTQLCVHSKFGTNAGFNYSGLQLFHS